jgi:hypothetical protein
MHAEQQTLDYHSPPELHGEGLIAEELLTGVVVRLPHPPLWRDVLQTVGALVLSAAAVAFIGYQTWSAMARGASREQWAGRLVVGVFCAFLVLAALLSVQRLRRRLRGEPVGETVFLPAADQPGECVTDVRVVGPVYWDGGGRSRLRISFVKHDPLELKLDGAPQDVAREAAELRRALRLPGYEPREPT